MPNPTLYRCPIDDVTQCDMQEPCNGCEVWAANKPEIEKPQSNDYIEDDICPCCNQLIKEQTS